jgi:hypothetical protein
MHEEIWSAATRFERVATNNTNRRAKRRRRFGWQWKQQKKFLLSRLAKAVSCPLFPRATALHKAFMHMRWETRDASQKFDGWICCANVEQPSRLALLLSRLRFGRGMDTSKRSNPSQMQQKNRRDACSTLAPQKILKSAPFQGHQCDRRCPNPPHDNPPLFVSQRHNWVQCRRLVRRIKPKENPNR